MTPKIEQGVKQELTTEVPQSSSNLTMNKIGKDMEAEVKFFKFWCKAPISWTCCQGAGYWSKDGRFGEETGRDCEVAYQFEVQLRLKIEKNERHVLRSELAGISSGMARRDSLMLGGNGLQQLQAFRWHTKNYTCSLGFQERFLWPLKKGFFDFGWRVSEWLLPIVSCYGGGTMDTNSRGESATFQGNKHLFFGGWCVGSPSWATVPAFSLGKGEETEEPAKIGSQGNQWSFISYSP